MRRVFPLSLLLLALARPLFPVRYPFINYRSSEGLPQSNVTALLQDRQGLIWVGTQAGLGQFDGTRFQTFTTREGLAGNYVTGLELDHEGDVWIATQDGLSRLRAGRFSSWPLADTFVRAIAYCAADRSLWALAAENLYVIRDGRCQRSTAFPDPRRLLGLAAGASGIAFYSADAVYRLQGGRLQRFPSPGAVQFAKEAGGHLFVGCRDGLYLLTPFGEFRKYAGMPAGLEGVSDILLDGHGGLWVGTRGGVLHRDLETGASSVLNAAGGLIYDRVSRLLLDREGNVFIGTEFGLSQLSRHLFRMYGSEDGLPSAQVWDILEDGGRMLLACDDGVAEIRNGAIRAFPVNARLRGRSLRAVVRLAPRRYLLGCRDGEILEWDGAGRLLTLTSGVNVLYAIRDSAGAAWFATDRGLLRYDGTDFSWFRQGLNDPIVWDVAELEPGTLLVGTRRGVQVLRDGHFVTSAWEKLVGRVIINDIHVVSPREALVASEMSGVYWLKGDTLTRLTQEQGLLHNDVWSVLRDDEGAVWINTTRALERHGADGSLSYFNTATGLFGDEGCIHAACQAGNGNLYFGIVPGLVELARPRGGAPPPPLPVIGEPRVNGKPRALAAGATLRHDENTIEFRYVCPVTSRERPLRYRTRLFPFDADWSPSTGERAVRYTNLPPGTYTFSVLASNGGGEKGWVGADQRIVFTIARPFWRRWWFHALELLLGLGVLALVVGARVRVLQGQKRRLEALVQVRTNEIAEKNRELAELSITDPLTGLKNRRFVDETIREDMSFIQREMHNVRQGLKPFDEKAAALGVFMIDADRFKRVNDLHGHEAGDAVIVEIARRLQAMMRQSDCVARWGGEEFLVITRQSRRADALPLAERIRLTIEGSAFAVAPGQSIRKTVSIGFCHYPFLLGGEEKLSWHQVVAMADSALYLAKHNGRNLVVGVQPGPVPFAGPGQGLLADLSGAVKAGHLELVCPKRPIRIPSHP